MYDTICIFVKVQHLTSFWPTHYYLNKLIVVNGFLEKFYCYFEFPEIRKQKVFKGNNNGGSYKNGFKKNIINFCL